MPCSVWLLFRSLPFHFYIFSCAWLSLSTHQINFRPARRIQQHDFRKWRLIALLVSQVMSLASARVKLCSIVTNVLGMSSQLWRDVVTEVVQGLSDVELSHMYVDNCANTADSLRRTVRYGVVSLATFCPIRARVCSWSGVVCFLRRLWRLRSSI
jgi:hypothetical protein